MLSDKHAAIAGKLDAAQTGLFTTGLAMRPVAPVTGTQAQSKATPSFAPRAVARPNAAPATMSLGSAFKPAGPVRMSEPSFGFQSQQSTSFLGSAADVVGPSTFQSVAPTPTAATSATTMSMFGGSASAAPAKRAEPAFMSTLGHQVNMSRYGGSRRGATVMMATATVSGGAVEEKVDHMDKVFLQ